MLASISQHALHARTFAFRDRRTPTASLFPLFDGDGTTRALMFTSESDEGRIALIDFDRRLFAGRPLLPRLGSQRIGLRHTALTDCGTGSSIGGDHGLGSLGLGSLWHFDPWWELTADRYAGHPAVPVLKSTNLPGFDEQISRVWFDRTLRRVTWIGFGEGESMKVRRFRPEMLVAAERGRDQRSVLGGMPDPPVAQWRLRPFWQTRAR